MDSKSKPIIALHFQFMEYFCRQDQPVTIKAAAMTFGLTEDQTHRYMKSLMAVGMATREPAKNPDGTPAAGHVYQSTRSIVDRINLESE